MKLGVKEFIELCIYCWGHPLLCTFGGSVAVWMLLSGNLQQRGPRPSRSQASKSGIALRHLAAALLPHPRAHVCA